MRDVREILENEDFINGIAEASSPEELGKVLERHNILLDKELSLEEAFRILKQQDSAELDDEALDDVSGGAFFAAAMGVHLVTRIWKYVFRYNTVIHKG